MKKNERIQVILKAIEKNNELKTAEILFIFENHKVERTAIHRDI